MTSSASRSAAQDKVLSWADLAEEEDSSKAYGLRLSYSKWKRRMQRLQQLPLKDESTSMLLQQGGAGNAARHSSEGTLSNEALSCDEKEQDDDNDNNHPNAKSGNASHLPPNKEVLEGLQSLEQGSNLDVTSLLIKKKKRIRDTPNKENLAAFPNSLVSCDFTQTQPPPTVCPPLGFDDVTDHQAIDALVDTLSRVLTRSLCQPNAKHLDLWGNGSAAVDDSRISSHPPIDDDNSLGGLDDAGSVPSGAGEEQVTTHIPSQPLTQKTSSQLRSERLPSVSSLESTSQHMARFSEMPRHGDGSNCKPTLPHFHHQHPHRGTVEQPRFSLRTDGDGAATQNGVSGGWPNTQSPEMFPANPRESPPPGSGFFPRSLSMPLGENHLAPPQFYPARNPFMSAGYDDQCYVGGFPVSEWRRFFVYLATMDTHGLLAYLSSQSGGAWCVERGRGPIIPTAPFQQPSGPSHQPTFSWPSCASQPQPPPPIVHSPLSMAQKPPPPPPINKSSTNALTISSSSSTGPSQQPQDPMTFRAPRRRAQSKPWRRQDIPPPSEGRFKQIARAKATPEYLLYIERIKKEDRDMAAGDPMTPRVEGTTWREFQQDVRAWKRSLHRKAESLQMIT